MALLRGEHLTKRFGGVTALDDMSFEIQEGEILGMIGPNGAGKTTLFNVVSGTLNPTEGEVYFGDDETRITDKSVHEIAYMGITRTYQITNIFPLLSVAQNLRIGAHQTAGARIHRSLLYGKDTYNDVDVDVERLIAFVGLEGSADTVAKNLPYGGKRRLALGIALASDPEVILLDEPMSGMNPTEIDEMVSLLSEIRERGITLFLVEHEMRSVMELSDRVLVLNEGQKLAEGPPAEIQNDEQVIEVYVGGGGK